MRISDNTERITSGKTTQPESSTRLKAPSYVELVIILSMMMSITALSIDTMLPSLPQIGKDLGITNPNDRQLIISVILMGQALGQLFFGPLSDKTGRKPAIFAGYLLFVIGCVVSIFSVNFPMMLVGRSLQGLGVSAPRAVATALVRDQFEGRLMARVMSFASTVLILVPLIAPSLGQGIISISGWRSIFGVFLAFALITVIWFAIRIPETLAEENRVEFSLQRITGSIRKILEIRSSVGYTLAAGLVSGSFIGYINSSQQIYQEQYALGDLFPLYFSTVSIALGTASFLNARLVIRYGMRFLVKNALRVIFGLGVVYFGISLGFGGQPPLWSLMAYLMASFFCIGILFGNLNALAMQPLGHLAGIGAAVVGSVSTLLSSLLGTVVGQSYNGTVLPLVAGLAILSGASIIVARWSMAQGN